MAGMEAPLCLPVVFQFAFWFFSSSGSILFVLSEGPTSVAGSREELHPEKLSLLLSHRNGERNHPLGTDISARPSSELTFGPRSNRHVNVYDCVAGWCL